MTNISFLSPCFYWVGILNLDLTALFLIQGEPFCWRCVSGDCWTQIEKSRTYFSISISISISINIIILKGTKFLSLTLYHNASASAATTAGTLYTSPHISSSSPLISRRQRPLFAPINWSIHSFIPFINYIFCPPNYRKAPEAPSLLHDRGSFQLTKNYGHGSELYMTRKCT